MANLYLDQYTDTWQERGPIEPSSPSAEDEYLATGDTEPADWQDLMLAMEGLTEKQKFVIALRFGMKDGYRYTLEECADLMGITFQAVDQIEQRALATLKFALNGTKPVEL